MRWNYVPGQIRALAGTVDWRNVGYDKGVQTIQISRVIVHAGWDRSLGQNDIAILQTSSPIQFTSQQGRVLVNKVCLPAPNQEFTGNALTSGWGYMSKYSRVSPDILRKVEIPIVDHNTCYNAFAQVIRVSTNQVCAGIVNKGNCMVCHVL